MNNYESGIENLINRKREAQNKECPTCGGELTEVLESNSTNHICNNNECPQIVF